MHVLAGKEKKKNSVMQNHKGKNHTHFTDIRKEMHFLWWLQNVIFEYQYNVFL